MTDDAPAPLRPVGPRSALLPVLTLGLGLGVAIGLGLGRATSPALLPIRSPTAATSPSAATPSWVTQASVSPEVLQAYYATRVTSAGVAPVVCTTDIGLACQGVPAYSSQTPASTQIPSPGELWPQLGPVHLAHPGGAVHALLIDDPSPAVYTWADILGPSEPWTETGRVASVSVNGAVVVMDLGRLGVGQYVVLIRQVFSMPTDRSVLVEAWKAIGIEVDR